MLDKKLFGKNLSDEINAILENDTETTDYIVLAGYLSILSENYLLTLLKFTMEKQLESIC